MSHPLFCLSGRVDRTTIDSNDGLRLGFDLGSRCYGDLMASMDASIQASDTKQGRSSNYISIPAGLVWLAVAAFLVRWLIAWAGGNLELGEGTSWVTLVILFFVASAACLGGVCIAIRAWLGPPNLSWQIFSLVLGLITLWAVAGH